MDKAPDIQPGKRLDRYVITQFLGRGGMGAVWKARDASLDRAVAVKVLHPRHYGDEFMILRFKREPLALARVTHRGVPQVMALEQRPDIIYFVLEYLDGKRLSELITEEYRLPAERAVDVFRQVAAALDAVHAAGVMHRDVKPGNVVVTASGRAVLMDFGLAKTDTWSARGGDPMDPNAALREFDAQETPHQTLAGTPAYMAPERWLRQEYDHRADIYSLGVLMFHTLTGVLPFGEEPDNDLIQGHIKGKAPRMATQGAPVPDALEGIVERCMRKDPERRFQSAADIVRALDDYETGLALKREEAAMKLSNFPVHNVAVAPPSLGRWLGAGGILALAVVVLFAMFVLPMAALRVISERKADSKNKAAAHQQAYDSVTQDNLGRTISIHGKVVEALSGNLRGWRMQDSATGSDVYIICDDPAHGISPGHIAEARGELKRDPNGLFYVVLAKPGDIQKK